MDDLLESLLDRVTHPLRVDRQLQQEVRRELLAHLQDAMAENRGAGMNDEEARQQAVRALGDEKLLSEQLWRANRRRIRIRTWVRWAIGVVALPAAVVVAVLALSSVLMSWSLMSALGHSVPWAGDLAANRFRHLIQSMPADDRLLFESQPFWVASPVQQWRERAAAAAARWPDDPALLANRVMAEFRARQKSTSSRLDDLEPLLELCDAGRRAEPDNGLYPLMKASALLANAAEAINLVVEDPEQVRVILDHREKHARGDPPRMSFSRYRIHDAAQFREGLALLHEAAGKPRISDYSVALAKRRIALLGRPRDFNDVLQGTALSVSVFLPSLQFMRGAADKATSAAVYPELAAMIGENNPDAQRNSIQDVYRIGQMVMRDAKESGMLVQFVVGKGLTELAVCHAIYSQEQANPGIRAEALREYDGTSAAMYRAAQNEHTEDTYRALGMVALSITPAVLTSDATEVRGGRQAEYAVFDSFSVSLMMLLLLAAGVVAMVPALWQRLAGTDGYVLLLPWRANLRILAPTVLAVIAVIGAMNFLPGTNRRYGLPFNGLGPISQYLLLFCVVLLLQKVILLRELGLKGLVATVSRRHRFYTLACIGGLVGLLVLGAMRDRPFGGRPAVPSLTDTLTMLAGLSLGLALIVSNVWRPKIACRQTASRSSRIAAVSAIILLACGVAVTCYTNVWWNGRGILAIAAGLTCMLGGAVCLVLWLADHLSPGLSRRHSAAARAAFGPIGILTALCMGLICLPALKWQEHTSVAAMLSGRTYLMENELERSTLKEVDDWLLSHPAPIPAEGVEQENK